MTRFPTAGHAASWAARCPDNHESAGKTPEWPHPFANRILRQALVESARGAVFKHDSYLAAQYRRLVEPAETRKAIVAAAHSILVIAYPVLRERLSYGELGADYFDHHHARRVTRYHTKRLAACLPRIGRPCTRPPVVLADSIYLLVVAGLHNREALGMAVEDAAETLILVRPPITVRASCHDDDEVDVIAEDAVEQQVGISRWGKPHDLPGRIVVGDIPLAR